MNTKIKLVTLLFISLNMLTACKQQPQQPVALSNTNNQLMATLYTYYAAEYKALTYQAYNIAKARLVEIKQLNPENKNLAIVLDIDETVLDNSPFEAKMIFENSEYNSESWNKWCILSVAEPVPGVFEFLQYADEQGFNIFYLSNRKKKYVQESTLKNLIDIGFPQANEDHLLLRDGERSKTIRRNTISEDYKIVLLVGDNLGDFYEDTRIFNEREQLVEKNKNLFGRKFIVLPNAMYGDWVSSIGLPGNKNTADSLLNVMIEKYHD